MDFIDQYRTHEDYEALEPLDGAAGAFHVDKLNGWFHHVVVPCPEHAFQATAKSSWDLELGVEIARVASERSDNLPGEEEGYIVWRDVSLSRPEFDSIVVFHPRISNRFKGKGIGASIYNLSPVANFEMPESLGPAELATVSRRVPLTEWNREPEGVLLCRFDAVGHHSIGSGRVVFTDHGARSNLETICTSDGAWLEAENWRGEVLKVTNDGELRFAIDGDEIEVPEDRSKWMASFMRGAQEK